MDDENVATVNQWFDSTFTVLNESYQLDLRQVISPETYELVHTLSDYYMYDNIGLLIHLLGLTSHYLTATSFIYADNQLKRKLNLHLLLVVRAGRSPFGYLLIKIYILRDNETDNFTTYPIEQVLCTAAS